MPLTWIDWLVIGGYLLINLGIGIYYRRRASGNTEEFFISGRNVSWWLAGTSMVATTFAADTPLFVSGVIATQGIAGNWLWWSSCLSGMLTVFFFARYWRRAEVLTDVELTELRYGGKPAAFLRGFKALYLGLIMNCLILGWVTNAMVSIIAVLLGPMFPQGKMLTLGVGGHELLHYTFGSPNHTALLICVFILIPFTGIYTSIGGLWGVLVTDLFQFILKMGMVIVLAWVAVAKIGGMQALKLQLAVVGKAAQQSGGQTSNPLAFFPDFHLGWTSSALWTLPVLTFLTYLGVQWWSAWYPGAEPGGGGYVAQRMFCARDEKNSLGATLWFNIAHYALRPWPWIITGLVALAVYSPHGGLHPSATFGAHPQEGYVMVLRDYLPPALRGVMVAAFLAAFMSTLGTQLNWGVSYLVNDLYRRFMAREKSERHYVGVGRLLTIAAGPDQRIRCRSVDVNRAGLANRAGIGHWNGGGVHPALVLVAHQCMERDFRNERGRHCDIGPTQIHAGRRSRDFRQRLADHGRMHHRCLGGCHIADTGGVRREAAGILSARASNNLWMEARGTDGPGDRGGSRRRQQRI